MTTEGRDAKKPVAAILLAFFVAVGLGAWIGLGKHAARLEAETARAVTGGARRAGDLFFRDLEAMKQAALDLPQATGFSHGIELWVELEGGKNGATAIDKTLLNPAWRLAPGELAAVRAEFLPAAIAAINEPARWRELRRGRTEFLRVRNWVAFAFGTTQTAPALGANFGGGTIIVLVDPARAFSSVASVAPGLTSYLATLDGHVLVHSSSAFNGAELGATQAFQAATQALARARASSGEAMSSLSARALVRRAPGEAGGFVTLAASQAPTLPLELVVEKQVSAPIIHAGLPARARAR